MKRENGIWYIKRSTWQIAGTFERACLIMGGHE
jgi:hypothetical protein